MFTGMTPKQFKNKHCFKDCEAECTKCYMYIHSKIELANVVKAIDKELNKKNKINKY